MVLLIPNIKILKMKIELISSTDGSRMEAYDDRVANQNSRVS